MTAVPGDPGTPDVPGTSDAPRTRVLPPRLTPSARKLRDTAARRGLHVVESSGFSVPELPRAQQGGAVHLHAGPSFVDAVAPALGIAPLEAPADWGSGCYDANPERALDTVLRAAGPVTELSPYDRDFVRRTR